MTLSLKTFLISFISDIIIASDIQHRTQNIGHYGSTGQCCLSVFCMIEVASHIVHWWWFKNRPKRYKWRKYNTINLTHH